MGQVYTYPNITQANYNTPGFYHIVKNENTLINVGWICTRDNASFTHAYLLVSIDNCVSWMIADNMFTSGVIPPTLSEWNKAAIDGVMVSPPVNTTFTLTICEFFDPNTVRRLGS